VPDVDLPACAPTGVAHRPLLLAQEKGGRGVRRERMREKLRGEERDLERDGEKLRERERLRER